MRRVHIPLLALGLIGTASGCDAESLDPECTVDAVIEISPALPAPDTVVSTDLVLNGTAEHSEGMTIRRLVVAGIPAQNTGFNFDAWTVTVPLSTLLAVEDPATGRASFAIQAYDTCSDPTVAEELVVEVLVDPLQNPALDGLEVSVSYPGEETYLPATGGSPATVTLSANAQAHGAQIDLAAAPELSLDDDRTTVTLMAPGDPSTGERLGPATASLTVTSTNPGTHLVTATGPSTVAAAPVRVVGPPVASPAELELLPGQAATLSMQTEGRLDRCQASPSSFISATVDGIDIATTPFTPSPADDDSAVQIRVELDDALNAAEELDITCLDPFGQSATATITARVGA